MVRIGKAGGSTEGLSGLLGASGTGQGLAQEPAKIPRLREPAHGRLEPGYEMAQSAGVQRGQEKAAPCLVVRRFT